LDAKSTKNAAPVSEKRSVSSSSAMTYVYTAGLTRCLRAGASSGPRPPPCSRSSTARASSSVPKPLRVERAYSMPCAVRIVCRTAKLVGPMPKIVCAALYLVFQCCVAPSKKRGTPLSVTFHVEYSRSSLIAVSRPTVGEQCREKRSGPSNEYGGHVSTSSVGSRVSTWRHRRQPARRAAAETGTP
jgi:hypothetical protein